MVAINKILIANRGEVALRIIKTAKKMGIQTVAIYSVTDQKASFVEAADESYALKGDTVEDTYNNVEKIIDIIRQSGADAVHPGYGFLSEKHDFVQRLEEEGVNFIGPSSTSMFLMGDKIEAKKNAIKAGVSVVPGFVGEIKDGKHIFKLAKEIGYPIILKASSGGGGKGMKIAYSDDDLLEAFDSATLEAKNNFNDHRVFLEKFIEKPRHIEVQLLADKHGNIVCLGERECSVQRFNQKIIEEAPSPFVSKSLRAKLYEQSVKLCKECGYFSAGTVEFIVDGQSNFYFMEMNTRLQVEHPVTEYVVRKDIVEEMIKIAQGEELGFSQKDVTITGHSIECRICAEDVARNFMPSIGRINEYQTPDEKYNVRIESDSRQGTFITPYYDAMIAKLITYGDSRLEAIQTMKTSLSQYHVEGIKTNIPLLEDVMRNKRFLSGNTTTGFIAEEYPNGFKGATISGEKAKDFICAAVILYMAQERKLRSSSKGYGAPILNEDRLANTNKLSVCINEEGEECQKRHIVSVKQEGYGTLKISNADFDRKISTQYSLNEKIVSFHTFVSSNSESSMLVNNPTKNKNQDVSVKVKYLKTGYQMFLGGSEACVSVHPYHIDELLDHMLKNDDLIDMKIIQSPLTGLITKIHVEEGEEIYSESKVVSIEAMKMENVVCAETDVVINKIVKNVGDVVVVGDILFEVSPIHKHKDKEAVNAGKTCNNSKK